VDETPSDGPRDPSDAAPGSPTPSGESSSVSHTDQPNEGAGLPAGQAREQTPTRQPATSSGTGSRSAQDKRNDKRNDKRSVVKGAGLGHSYVRIRVPTVQTFRWRGEEGTLEPQEHTPSAGSTDAPAALTDQASPAAPASEKTHDDIALPGLEHRVIVSGRRLGPTYVRRELPGSSTFRSRGENVLEASERVLQPQSAFGRSYGQVRRALLGRRLATAEQIYERLTKVKALAVLSSDAISSVAYATEASLGILIAAGVAALHINPFLGATIVLVMLIVGTSYRQTIYAYPNGGGSYIVARDNLGTWPGLIAAAALLIDYVLTVSVSVSSGIDFLISSVPQLGGLDVVLGVGCVVLILLINLRGIRESGTIFTAPTYLFIAVFLIMIVAGVAHALFSPGGLLGAVAPTATPVERGWSATQEPLTWFLILTAFSAGCVAMTGTEAISNGIPAFKPPESRNAARTLLTMIAILATFYLGTTYLAWRFGLVPYASQQPTINHQIAALLFTGPFSWFVYLLDFATLLLLVLAANTSFADFPRLSSILARDGFLPHQFAFRGDRLAFSVGIIVLGALSSALIVIFHGSTDALINLYALGVFVAFTLSQTGMVVHWYRLRDAAGARWRFSLAINLTGAIATGVVALVIGVTKFDRGAWVVVLLVPLLVLLFRGVANHYASVRRQTDALTPLRAEELRHIMVVPIAELNRPALQSLAYARSLTAQVIAVHVAIDHDEEVAFRAEWDRWVERRQEDLALVAQTQAQAHAEAPAAEAREPYDGSPRERAAVLAAKRPQLVVIQSPYRSLVAPLVAYIDALRDANPDMTISVVVPEFVPAHWWERLLHNQTALRLKLAFYSDPGVVVINVPYHLRR
jgi:amino acid transporter